MIIDLIVKWEKANTVIKSLTAIYSVYSICHWHGRVNKSNPTKSDLNYHQLGMSVWLSSRNIVKSLYENTYIILFAKTAVVYTSNKHELSLYSPSSTLVLLTINISTLCLIKTLRKTPSTKLLTLINWVHYIAEE